MKKHDKLNKYRESCYLYMRWMQKGRRTATVYANDYDIGIITLTLRNGRTQPRITRHSTIEEAIRLGRLYVKEGKS